MPFKTGGEYRKAHYLTHMRSVICEDCGAEYGEHMLNECLRRPILVTPAPEPVSERSYSPWIPMSDPLDLKRMGKLGEEAGELGSVVSRCIIQGIDGEVPDEDKTNRRWLEEEIADVEASAELAKQRWGLDRVFIEERKQKKIELLKGWGEMLVERKVA